MTEFFNRVYEALVQHAGAADDEDSRLSFIQEFLGDQPTSQYRFQGSLGFGGKFLFPAFNVSAYPEDLTQERKDAIRAANAALAGLRIEYLERHKSLA